MTIEKRKKGDTVLPTMRPFLLDEESVPAAQAVFSSWKANGTILSESLYEDTIKVTDQVKTTTLSFGRISEEDYASNWKDFFDIPFASFLLWLKCGIILCLGISIFSSLRETILDFEDMVSRSYSEFWAHVKAGRLRQPVLFSNLLLRFPYPHMDMRRDELADTIMDIAYEGAGKRRVLPNVRSVLQFYKAICDLWKNGTSLEKGFYGPLYLWTRICTIIPTRPYEFLLTSDECLHQDAAGAWTLTMRKTLLKGQKPIKDYTIEQDYKEVTFPITKDLADDINEYKKLAAQYRPNRLGTLFVPELHYQGLGRTCRYPHGFYTYSNFNYAMYHFQLDIMIERHGCTLFGDDALEFLHQGDSRHFSCINLVGEGIPLATAVLLSGHKTINQFIHYGGNIHKYLECAVCVAYKEQVAKAFPLTLNPSFLKSAVKQGDPFVEVDEGLCYSRNFVKDDVRDCICSLGPNGEVGWCPGCQYFRKQNTMIAFTDASGYRVDAGDDWALLRDVSDTYRREYLGAEKGVMELLEDAKLSNNPFEDLVQY